MEPALGNSPPLLLLLPQKADPNKFIRFHIDAFFNFLTHPCLERPKTTVWIHCSALESGLWWPGAPNLPSTTLGCIDPTLPVHLLSCALNLLLLWGKHPSCREGMGRAGRGSGSGWRSAGGAGKVDKRNFGLWLRAVVPHCPARVSISTSALCHFPVCSWVIVTCKLRWELPESLCGWAKVWVGERSQGQITFQCQERARRLYPHRALVRDKRAAVGHLWRWIRVCRNCACIYLNAWLGFGESLDTPQLERCLQEVPLCP